MTTLTPIEPWDDTDCPVIEIEMARDGTDQSDFFRSDHREASVIANSCCDVCASPLLATRRWFRRGDGLEVHQRLTECSCCDWRRIE